MPFVDCCLLAVGWLCVVRCVLLGVYSFLIAVRHVSGVACCLSFVVCGFVT